MRPDRITLPPQAAAKYALAGNTLARTVKGAAKDRIDVEIGDASAPEFKPHFKFKRWGGEVGFSLSVADHPAATVEIDGEVVRYIKPNHEIHLYDKPDAGEDGGFEFEWFLPQNPGNNTLTANIATEGLSFFYQGELTAEEVAEGCSRPDNVIGSYAVYHSTKGGLNKGDGNDYKTGKAFHIYRPKAVDNSGAEAWCDLNIDTATGILTVTVPQAFLSGADYPVRVDPTFGYTTIGGSTIGSIGNTQNKIAVLSGGFTAASGDTITSFSIYTINSDASGTLLAAAYTVVAGSPSARLAAAENITVSNSATWYSTATVSQALTASTGYCTTIGFGNLAGDSVTLYFDAGSPPGRINALTVAMSDPFDPTGTDSGRQYSVYATYTAGGGATTGDLDVDGVATVNFTGGATQRAALNSTGTSTATFVGAGNMAGTLSSAGTSSVNFGGAQIDQGVLSIDGFSTVNFVGAVAADVTAGALQSAGASTVNFVGADSQGGALASDGVSTVNFVGASTSAGALSINGISTVNFEGAQQGVVTGALSVTGTSTVEFVGEAIGGGVVVPENPLMAGGAVGYHSMADRRRRKIKAQDDRDLADITKWLQTEIYRQAA